jgi:hypothetical protein
MRRAERSEVTDYNTEALNEAKAVIRDTWEDLIRLRACNENSKLMIIQSQRLIADSDRPADYEEIRC